MTGNKTQNAIEVRTFETMDEIRSLERFEENNPVNEDNYDRIIGDYDFAKEVKCCRETSIGRLCGEGHKRGFVASLKDSSISIVGNCCAKDKFGANVTIKADRSKYINEKRRRTRFAEWDLLAAQKEIRLDKLELLRGDLKAVQEEIKCFLDALGEKTRRRLQDMARTANVAISVNAVTYKYYIDEKGEKQKEIRVSPQKLGSLDGLSVFNDQLIRSLYSSLNKIKLAYIAGESITDEIKISELEALINSVNDFDRIETSIQDLRNELVRLFASDLSLLCYLVDDKSERYKSARVALERTGDICGKDKAKVWLSEKDQVLKDAFNADKIEIQY